MFVIRKRPELSVVRLLTAAVPWFVMVTAADGTTAPAGSTTVPRIELLCVWPNMATHPNANMDMGSAILLSFILSCPFPLRKNTKSQNRFEEKSGTGSTIQLGKEYNKSTTGNKGGRLVKVREASKNLTYCRVRRPTCQEIFILSLFLTDFIERSGTRAGSGRR